MVVGIAFDYFLRFDLHRRMPHATTNPWIAQKAIDRFGMLNEGGGHVDVDRMQRIVEQATDAVGNYLLCNDPTDTQRRELAKHAILLAKFDFVYRNGLVVPDFGEYDSEDVNDLVDMLAIVPFDDFVNPDVALLNPEFGNASSAVRGADADLISGDLLADIKVTIKGALSSNMFDQLLGYFLLARWHREDDPLFPEIRRVGVYFARHGELCTWNAREYTALPGFAEFENWFRGFVTDK